MSEDKKACTDCRRLLRTHCGEVDQLAPPRCATLRVIFDLRVFGIFNLRLYCDLCSLCNALAGSDTERREV
ncbi:hypothetical protein NC652_012509 [Populus alba x Populus x berolinensis]|nr:hypothetical protein NC652_012509 [Populus alba x Populus x berolinensis]